jgi:hypothetical protein
MNKIAPLSLIAAALLAPPAARPDEPNKWAFDASLYALAPSMSGNVVVKGIPADVDFGLDRILDTLEFGAMGKVRLGYERWALTTDVLYMGLQGSKNGLTVELDQWMVEPTISYRVSKYFEPLAGARYNNLRAELRGPGILPTPRVPSGTEDWWDPIVGANLTLPLGKHFSLNVRGDIGGFGLGSDLTWQAFPYVSWQFTKWGSLQLGYRWVNSDYETGSGSNRFKYDVLTQGPQVGVTFHF